MSFSLLTLASTHRWRGPSGELQASDVITQKWTVYRPWIFTHSYHYAY